MFDLSAPPQPRASRAQVPVTSVICGSGDMNVGNDWVDETTRRLENVAKGRPFDASDYVVCNECNKIQAYCICQKETTLPVQVKPTFQVVGDELAITHLPIINMMKRLGWEPAERGTSYGAATAVIFPGGMDVDPKLYGDCTHPKTAFHPKLDQQWMSIYGHLKSPDVLKIGICRGAQFLCVANGGKLWQDVDNHVGTHEALYRAKNGDNIVFDVTSTHHQMMRPVNNTWAEVWCSVRLAKYRDTGVDRGAAVTRLDGPDPEVVWFPNTRSLCFQPHPEYAVESCTKLFKLCLDRAMGGSE